MPVVLLVHCDGTNGSTTFTDVSASAHGLTATSATINTASPKFGTGSGDFSSVAASRVLVDTVADFQFGSGQFTIEAWGYFTSAPGAGTSLVMGNFSGSTNLGWDFGMVSGALAFYYSTTGTNNLNVGVAYTPPTNQWIHLAVDRDASNVLRVYADGVVKASATVASTFFNSSGQFRIGNDSNLNRNFLGRLDEIRVTKGLAQYAGAFTPPTAPFGTVDLAGNLGLPSSYGRLAYGMKHYSRGGPFAPTFVADFTVSAGITFSGDFAPSVSFGADLGVVFGVSGDLVPAIVFGAVLDVVGLVDFGGDVAPQIALGGSVSLDLPLTALDGSFGFTVVLAASGLISGPLWAASTPCPTPPWTPTDPCPPPMWTSEEPNSVTWDETELCNG